VSQVRLRQERRLLFLFAHKQIFSFSKKKDLPITRDHALLLIIFYTFTFTRISFNHYSLTLTASRNIANKKAFFFFFFLLLLLPLPFKVKCCMYHSTCGCIGFLIAMKAEKSAKVSEVVKWAFCLIMFSNKLLTCLFWMQFA